MMRSDFICRNLHVPAAHHGGSRRADTVRESGDALKTLNGRIFDGGRLPPRALERVLQIFTAVHGQQAQHP